ncbi:MAG TPA: glucose-6-phosphate dehydrogenase assembly protein OpcA [Terriglobales bacterium]|nr:glucose-6-phosphate dehydrogenase assembly protein OpcA [Terriglobales bacterium]
MASCDTVPVNVASIERELRNLWRHEAEDEQARSGQPVVCARTLNLLIYPAETENPEFIAELMDPITTRHPSRAVLIEPARPDATAEFEARVSASCAARQGTGVLGCELIMLRSRPCAYEKIHSIVLPLLVPDLPIFLWWRKPLAGKKAIAARERELFDGLVKLANRVIIDSAHLSDPAAQIHKLAESIRVKRVHAAFSDLAWARLTMWRQLIAQFFDGPNITYVNRVTEVAIQYGADEVVPPEPLLLAGWLASRLNWDLPQNTTPWKQGEAHELTLVRNGGQVRLRFEPVEVPDIEGVMSVKITAENNGAAEFSVSRRKGVDGFTASISKQGEAPMHRMVRGREISTAEMVSKELEILQHDLLYEEALNAAASLTGNS